MMGVKRDLVTMGDLEQDRQGQSLAPATALCAVSSTSDGTSHLTPNTCQSIYSMERGKLLGAVKPAWIKVQESEARLKWLKSMVERKLVVRNIESFALAENERLRTESEKLKDEEREVLLGLMAIKVKDERNNLLALQQTRERVQ